MHQGSTSSKAQSKLFSRPAPQCSLVMWGQERCTRYRKGWVSTYEERLQHLLNYKCMKVTKLEISSAEKGKPDSFPTILFMGHHGLREQVKSRQSREMPSPSFLASPFLPLSRPPSRTSSSLAAVSSVLSLLTVDSLCLFHLKCNSFQTKSKED